MKIQINQQEIEFAIKQYMKRDQGINIDKAHIDLTATRGADGVIADIEINGLCSDSDNDKGSHETQKAEEPQKEAESVKKTEPTKNDTKDTNNGTDNKNNESNKQRSCDSTASVSGTSSSTDSTGESSNGSQIKQGLFSAFER